MTWRKLKYISKFAALFPSPVFRLLWRCSDIFEGRPGSAIRYVLIASRLRACGTNVYIATHVFIHAPQNVSLGSNVSIHENVVLISPGGISIGDDVAIAHGCSLVTSEHTWSSSLKSIKYNPITLSKIVIENDVWLGCGVKVLSGSTIHSRTVIAAGAVVNRDCESGGLYGGVPAKLIKSLS